MRKNVNSVLLGMASMLCVLCIFTISQTKMAYAKGIVWWGYMDCRTGNGCDGYFPGPNGQPLWYFSGICQNLGSYYNGNNYSEDCACVGESPYEVGPATHYDDCGHFYSFQTFLISYFYCIYQNCIRDIEIVKAGMVGSSQIKYNRAKRIGHSLIKV